MFYSDRDADRSLFFMCQHLKKSLSIILSVFNNPILLPALVQGEKGSAMATSSFVINPPPALAGSSLVKAFQSVAPGDFGLTPPADPRQGKSLCDGIGVFTRAEALALLKAGLFKGLVSDRSAGDWPKNIWSMTSHGRPLEAQLENPESGTYHGYPMPDSDPFASLVAQRWADAHV